MMPSRRNAIALSFASVCVPLLGACDQPATLAQRPPFFAASSDVIDFGGIEVGEDDERTLFLINKGDKALTVTDIQGDTEGGVFAIVPESYEVRPGSDVLVRVRFSPADVKDYLSVITVANDSSNEPAFHLTLQGEGTSPDPCKGVTCNSPPAPACLGTQTSRIYDPAGTCSGGVCTYTPFTETCTHGCNQETGLCNDDPCTGVVCNAPPNACYNAIGLCSQGGCVYAPSNSAICNDDNPCTVNDSCSEGTCRGTPKVCNDPPVATCLDATTRRVWQTQGTCDGQGLCQYVSQDQTCAHGCDGASGTCNGDPCAGVTCDQPPNICYAATGTCDGGGCSYGFANGKSCNDADPCTVQDTCSAGACQGTAKSCVTPPSAVCQDSQKLRQYQPVGACNAGTGNCDYASTLTTCAYGCENGACKNEPTYGQDVVDIKLVHERELGSLVQLDYRDIDVEYVNPVGGKCGYDQATPTWGNYGTCQWSASPNPFNSETIVHGAPKGGAADGNYRVLGKVWSLCAEVSPICIGGVCPCLDTEPTSTTVEIRINNVLEMTCTYEFRDGDDDPSTIEYAVIQRENGFYKTPVPSSAAGVSCTAH